MVRKEVIATIGALSLIVAAGQLQRAPGAQPEVNEVKSTSAVKAATFDGRLLASIASMRNQINGVGVDIT